MFIKKLDILSPPITLFFSGEPSNSSIFSGILSITSYLLIVVAAFYYALKFINRDSPKAYFVNRYVEDAGNFPVNATQMFHFIQIEDPSVKKKLPFDYASFRIVGFDSIFAGDYSSDPSIIETIAHWVYGNCNNNSDTKGIGYLITQDYYEQSACIRKYYDVSKKTYYETGEEGFRWPVIEKGCSNPKRTYYGLVMQRCDMTSSLIREQGPECKTSSEIDEVIAKSSFNFEIIDHYADILNYEKPFTKYLYEVTSEIANNYFAVQHLNFNPANILTHNGFFFDNQVKEEAYIFTQNDKQNIEGNIHGCLIGVFYWMQNTLQYYERNYDRIQDILSNIGGISRTVSTVAFLLNLLVNNYIVLLNTEEFVLNTERENFSSRDMSHKPTILRKEDNILFPPRRRPYQIRKEPNRNDSNQQQQSTNYQKLMKDGVDIYSNINSRNDNIGLNKNTYSKNSGTVNNYNNDTSKEGVENNYINNKVENIGRYGNRKNQRRGYKREEFNSKSMITKNTKDENITQKKEDLERPLENQNFKYCAYLKYLICCKRNNKNISYYEEFRAKMLSEENIIQSYLDIYKLLKVSNIEKRKSF